MTEAARLVDELTTLLYEVLKRWEVQGRVCEIVACGACRKKADKPESVVHDADCPVYRLIRAEEANTAVIRANADEIADLEDRRDELEGRVNALTAEMECRNELSREVARLKTLLAERDAEIALLREAGDALTAKSPCFVTIRPGGNDIECCQFCLTDNAHAPGCEWVGLVAALAARGGEGQT